MIQAKSLIGAARAAAMLAACTPPAATEPSELTGDWLVQQIAGASLNAEERIYFGIGAEAGTISGSTGCNDFTGAVTQFERTVTITNVTATERACADAAAQTNETRFLMVLPAITRYARNGAQLELLGNAAEPDALILARADNFATPAE
jgi:heat shock protein HslJ